MTGDRPTTPGWHCHRCRSTSCRQRADSDTDHVGRVEYRPLLLTQPSSVSWLWSHTHWCPSQRPQEVMRVDGSANPTMPKNPAQYALHTWSTLGVIITRLSIKGKDPQLGCAPGPPARLQPVDKCYHQQRPPLAAAARAAGWLTTASRRLPDRRVQNVWRVTVYVRDRY